VHETFSFLLPNGRSSFRLGRQRSPGKPYIYVQGRAEIQKAADQAILTFDLVVRAPDQPKTNDQLQATANKIFDLLNNRKIAENLISEPEFEQEETYPRRRGKLLDYRVTRTFRVKVRDVTVFPKLVNDLLAIGNVEFSSIESGFSKEKELEIQIWDKALTNARERADKTVNAMGMKIDSVFAVSPVAFLEIESKLFGAAPGSGEAEVQRVIETPQYRLAPVTVSQSVHVIYLISPVK
jgi:uncharacterized protein YggE